MTPRRALGFVGLRGVIAVGISLAVLFWYYRPRVEYAYIDILTFVLATVPWLGRSALASCSWPSLRRSGGGGIGVGRNWSPNPRLQRTRSAPLRSPLSRKPFGST